MLALTCSMTSRFPTVRPGRSSLHKRDAAFFIDIANAVAIGFMVR